ncbi:MAG: hypothetical protein V4858_17075 [Pseudomonadota bacterium]
MEKNSNWLSAYEAIPLSLRLPCEITRFKMKQFSAGEAAANTCFVDGLACVESTGAEGAELGGGEHLEPRLNVWRQEACEQLADRGCMTAPEITAKANRLHVKRAAVVAVVVTVSPALAVETTALAQGANSPSLDGGFYGFVSLASTARNRQQLEPRSLARGATQRHAALTPVAGEGLRGGATIKANTHSINARLFECVRQHALGLSVVNQRTTSGVRPTLILDAHPCLLWAEVFASNHASTTALYLWAVLGRDAFAALPVSDGGLLQLEKLREFFLAPDDFCGFFNGFDDIHGPKYRITKQTGQQT